MILRTKKNNKLTSPQNVANLLRELLNMENQIDRDKEHFWVIGVNTQNIVKYVDLVALGILDQVLIHPREVFRTAIYHGVASIVIGHNHPGGNREPSDQDQTLTRNLVECSKILSIPVLDHIIITNDNYFSFRELTSIINKT
ncbi:DNA repair protein RadC [Desulfobacterota bacterium AH_259_B03_O07]|nr:DNA repair protein RadC [Desulfobacterota bacterium AH_259_B03_O07]